MALGSIPPVPRGSNCNEILNKLILTYMSFDKLGVLIIFNAKADERNSSD